MKITSFRIKNYRSIKDSGECYLSDDNITILVGKNESGKTAVLEALADFNFDKPIRDDARPLNGVDVLPEITINFEVDEKTIGSIRKKNGNKFNFTQPFTLQVTKTYPQNYTYNYVGKSGNNEAKSNLKDTKLLARQNQISADYTQIINMYGRYATPDMSMPDLDFNNLGLFVSRLKEYRKSIQPSLEQMGNSAFRIYDFFVSTLEQFESPAQGDTDIGQEILSEWIPNFILFSSFEDIFPSEIPINEASSNELVKDLNTISNLNLDLVQTGSASQKAKHKRQLNLKLSSDYKKFWEQDATNLYIDWDSEKLDFFVTEHDDFYPPKMRSKGKQWHLSFFIRVLARAREGDNIILIDEPGLYLHPHAQKDILATLEDCATMSQVVFSTHSPYFVAFDKLSRVRLISRTMEHGTTVSNKIYKDADNDTLTPIVTAIGLDLSQGLDVNKNNNIIFEKVSDYYYALAFQELLHFRFNQNVHFIPSLGSGQAVTLATLMVGWELNFCIVLDNNSRGRKMEPKLLHEFANDNIKIIKVSEKPDEEIEDLFSREDFIKYVLRDGNTSVLPADMPKSSVIKHEGRDYDRVLLSGLFLKDVRAGEVTVSNETLDNFYMFFQKLNTLLFPTQQT